MSLRNTAAGIGLSFLSGCMDASSSSENKPEMETVRDTLTAQDPGSEEGRNKLVVDEMEEQLERQVGGRIDELLEGLRSELAIAATNQANTEAHEYFGSSCTTSFHSVEGVAFEESIPNKIDNYSIQELTAVQVASELPTITTVWGEYQNEQWVGGFNVVSACLPSGAETVLGKSAMEGLRANLATSGFNEKLDLSSVLNDDLIIQSTKVTEKNNLEDGSTVGYRMDSHVTVFMKK